MIARLGQIWTDRSPREQRMLLAMMALFAVVVVWIGILRPLTDANAAAAARLDRVTVEAGEIATAADTLRQARKSVPPPLLGTLPLAVGASASAVGFTLASVEPQAGDRVAITIASAKSQALFGWLRALSQQGIFVERMTLRTNSDATLGVDATLRLRES